MRARIKNEILNLIDSHKKFVISDFSFTEKGTVFSIVYDYDENCHFKIDFPTSVSDKTLTEENTYRMGMSGKKSEIVIEVYIIDITLSPGELLSNETIRIEGKQVLLKKLGIWLDNLWADLTTDPINRTINKNFLEVQEIKSRIKSMPDEFFSKEEADNLRNKLDEIAQQLSEQITAHAASKEEISKLEESLKNEINNLKETLFSLKKEKWYKSAASKIYSWVSKEDNRKLLKDGAAIIKPFLLDS